MVVLPNLFRYFLPYLVYFEIKLCMIVLLKFVPLLFISSRVFNDKNVHDDYLKSVPLLFISSGILKTKLRISNLFRYFLLYLVYLETKLCMMVLPKIVPLLFTPSSIFWHKIIRDGFSNLPLSMYNLFIISWQNYANNVIQIFCVPFVFFWLFCKMWIMNQ